MPARTAGYNLQISTPLPLAQHLYSVPNRSLSLSPTAKTNIGVVHPRLDQQAGEVSEPRRAAAAAAAVHEPAAGPLGLVAVALKADMAVERRAGHLARAGLAPLLGTLYSRPCMRIMRIRAAINTMSCMPPPLSH